MASLCKVIFQCILNAFDHMKECITCVAQQLNVSLINTSSFLMATFAVLSLTSNLSAIDID